jgi:rhodanese-related sulfurtransferase
METHMKRRNFFGLLGVLAIGPVLAQAPPIAQSPQAASSPPAAAMSQVTQVSPDALLEMQAQKDASLFLLDVRKPEEFSAGHIPGAVNIPYDQVAARLGEIPKGDEVVLYCHSGRRAGLAAEVLAANGYTKLAHLEGDMQGWQSAGRPVESSTEPASTK